MFQEDDIMQIVGDSNVKTRNRNITNNNHMNESRVKFSGAAEEAGAMKAKAGHIIEAT